MPVDVGENGRIHGGAGGYLRACRAPSRSVSVRTSQASPSSGRRSSSTRGGHFSGPSTRITARLSASDPSARGTERSAWCPYGRSSVTALRSFGRSCLMNGRAEENRDVRMGGNSVPPGGRTGSPRAKCWSRSDRIRPGRLMKWVRCRAAKVRFSSPAFQVVTEGLTPSCDLTRRRSFPTGNLQGPICPFERSPPGALGRFGVRNDTQPGLRTSGGADGGRPSVPTRSEGSPRSPGPGQMRGEMKRPCAVADCR